MVGEMKSILVGMIIWGATCGLCVEYDAIVSKDGSGGFSTISAAIEAAPSLSTKRYRIFVKQGKYEENVHVPLEKHYIALIGDVDGTTVITGSRSPRQGYTTYTSATVGVEGENFIAMHITFENSAGEEAGPAVSMRSTSDHSAFYNCTFYGFQDTLNPHLGVQFYKDCNIYGSVDFIFGIAKVVIQDSRIYTRPLKNDQKTRIVAQGRNDKNDEAGTVLHNCVINAMVPGTGGKAFLATAWKEYAVTVIMQSYLGSVVDPLGYTDMYTNNYSEGNTIFFAEYGNRGPGADTSGRIKWPGYKVITSRNEANYYTVRNFIDGVNWLPATGIPFRADLI